MKKRYTEEQIIGFLREADAGLPVKELCRKHGFSEPSYYAWKAKFGCMNVSDAQRLKGFWQDGVVPIAMKVVWLEIEGGQFGTLTSSLRRLGSWLCNRLPGKSAELEHCGREAGHDATG